MWNFLLILFILMLNAPTYSSVKAPLVVQVQSSPQEKLKAKIDFIEHDHFCNTQYVYGPFETPVISRCAPVPYCYSPTNRYGCGFDYWNIQYEWRRQEIL